MHVRNSIKLVCAANMIYQYLYRHHFDSNSERNHGTYATFRDLRLRKNVTISCSIAVDIHMYVHICMYAHIHTYMHIF